MINGWLFCMSQNCLVVFLFQFIQKLICVCHFWKKWKSYLDHLRIPHPRLSWRLCQKIFCAVYLQHTIFLPQEIKALWKRRDSATKSLFCQLSFEGTKKMHRGNHKNLLVCRRSNYSGTVLTVSAALNYLEQSIHQTHHYWTRISTTTQLIYFFDFEF